MTPEKFEEICASIETLTEGVGTICESVGATQSDFWAYISRTPEAQERYARAKQIQAEILASEILSIADTTQEGVKVVEKPTGIETITGDMIEHRRLRVESRKWLLSKLLPKKYGDKLDLTSKGNEIAASPLVVMCSTPESKNILERMARGEQPGSAAPESSTPIEALGGV